MKWSGKRKATALLQQSRFLVVCGATVADWDANARELTVGFIEPVQDSTRLTVSGELRLPRAGKIDVPLGRLSGILGHRSFEI